MPLTPLERKAAFAHAVTMHETTKTEGALSVGYSWTHLEGVMEGTRPGSHDMKARLADYCGIPVDEFWGEPESDEGQLGGGAIPPSRQKVSA